MDIVAMKNINGFVVNTEARQEEFERNCMRTEEALTRLQKEYVSNVNLNTTMNRLEGIYQNLRERHNRAITMMGDIKYEMEKQICTNIQYIRCY